MTDRLVHWATSAPDRTWIARAQRLQPAAPTTTGSTSATRRPGRGARHRQALMDRGLSAERPVVILSENSLEHALLALGCLYAGVPFVPTSPAYSLISQDFDKLRHVLRTVTPGLVYASDWARYGKAIAATDAGRCSEVVLVDGVGELGRCPLTSFAALAGHPRHAAVDAAMQATGPDTIVKFLFTSGSTKLPKAVINTQRMWCANQQQMRSPCPC
jgi:feruloyl-CoA synthase